MASELSELRQVAREAFAVDPGPWRFDGRDIFTDAKNGAAEHHLVIPLPETWHESQRVPDEIARYVATFSPSVVLGLLSTMSP